MTPNRLTLSRELRADVQDVWRAWTTTEGLARWWWPHWPDTTYRLDVGTGGEWRIEAPGAGIAVHGTYLTVDEPRHLAFTWIWVDGGADGPTEHVDVRLTPTPDGTALEVTHRGPWDGTNQGELYTQGWQQVLDCLGSTITVRGSSVG